MVLLFYNRGFPVALGWQEVLMFSPFSILIILGVVLAAAAVFGVAVAIAAYLRFRGKRVITCPENKQPAAVHIDIHKVAKNAMLGKLDVRLDECSRWPERAGCGQDCLSQIHADPEKCLVWNLVDDWYKGKSCAYCQKPFGEIHWHDRQPGLMGPDHSVVPWNEVPPENLPQVFQNYLPVCWNCYIAEEFRRKNPERVVERRWDRGAGGSYVPKESSDSATETNPAGQLRR